MIRSKTGKISACAAFALAICIATGAKAQYSVVPGNTPGGGNTVTGNGPLLGSLITNDGNLSPGGFDQITLNIGSIANDLSNNGSTITIYTNGNLVVNNGTINGSTANGGGFFATTALGFGSYAPLSNETVINNGTILGGNSSGGEFGIGGGVVFVSGSNSSISSISVLNNGTITAGNSNGDSRTGDEGVAIVAEGGVSDITIVNNGSISAGFNTFGSDFNSNGITVGDYGLAGTGINGVSIKNSGLITGGASNFSSQDFSTGAGVAIVGVNQVTNVTVENTATGSIIGGSLNEQTFPGILPVFAGTGLGIGSVGSFNPIPGNIGFPGYTDLTNVLVVNAGNITGGSPNEGGADVGSAVALLATGNITNATIKNSGNLLGGSDSAFGFSVGNGLSILAMGDSSYFYFGGPGPVGSGMPAVVSGVTITNSGKIIGGDDNNGTASIDSISYGNGIAIAGYTGVSNVIINNYGSVIGGNEGFDAIYVSNGIAVDSGDALNSLTINNMGLIMGGNNGSGDWNDNGIIVESSNDMNGFTLNNFSSIIGGNSDLGQAGWGVALDSDNGDINNAVINNFGLIAAGFGGGGIGLYIDANKNINNLTVWNTGSILGGSGAAGTNGGAAIFIEASNGALSGGLISNMGLIRGGDGGSGGTGGNGITFIENASGGNFTMNNWGTIAGGNGDAADNAGFGIATSKDNLTINNWGAISAGSGVSTATVAGFPPIAISLQGSNSTINLNGHSSVNGTLQGLGTGNVINLNFTGVSPQELANLKAQLTAQGWPGTNNFTGSFTLRGVTYDVDPIPLNIQGITSYEGQAKTPNQFAVGANLDSLSYNPAPGTPLFNLLNAIDQSGAVPQALEALSPQKFEIYGELAIANATQMTLEIDQRLNNLRDGSESIDTTGVGGGSDQTTTAGYSKDDSKDNKNVVQTAAPEKRWGFFAAASGLVFRGNVKDVDLQQGKSDNGGTIAGIDGKVGEHAVIGALFAYNNADATLGSDNSHAVIESYSGGLYGSYHQDGFYVNGLAAYTRNDYNNTRNILFPGFGGTASSQTSGNQASVNLDGGYDWHATDRLTVGPLAGLQYVHLDVDSFNESGGTAANLSVNSQDLDSLQSRIGVRADYHLQVKQDVAFATEISAAWQHEYLDDSRAISASFEGAGLAPFSVQTASPKRDAGVVSLGMNFTFHDRLTLFADYSLLMWNASYYEQTLNGGLRISF